MEKNRGKIHVEFYCLKAHGKCDRKYVCINPSGICPYLVMQAPSKKTSEDMRELAQLVTPY